MAYSLTCTLCTRTDRCGCSDLAVCSCPSRRSWPILPPSHKSPRIYETVRRRCGAFCEIAVGSMSLQCEHSRSNVAMPQTARLARCCAEYEVHVRPSSAHATATSSTQHDGVRSRIMPPVPQESAIEEYRRWRDDQERQQAARQQAHAEAQQARCTNRITHGSQSEPIRCLRNVGAGQTGATAKASGCGADGVEVRTGRILCSPRLWSVSDCTVGCNLPYRRVSCSIWSVCELH